MVDLKKYEGKVVRMRSFPMGLQDCVVVDGECYSINFRQLYIGCTKYKVEISQTNHQAIQEIAIKEEPSDLEKSILKAMLSGEKDKVTVELPMKVYKLEKVSE